jgi:hypothetical protein
VKAAADADFIRHEAAMPIFSTAQESGLELRGDVRRTGRVTRAIKDIIARSLESAWSGPVLRCILSARQGLPDRLQTGDVPLDCAAWHVGHDADVAGQPLGEAHDPAVTLALGMDQYGVTDGRTAPPRAVAYP